MKKDIDIPKTEGIAIAVVREWNEEFLSQDWNAYILNQRTDLMKVLVVTKGYDVELKTSTMRHAIKEILPNSYAKIELMQEMYLS